jgi:osmotically-inducible protein OsmY
VVSQNGRVTLRGVVASQEEKDKILAKVHANPDVHDCDNQLDVKSN